MSLKHIVEVDGNHDYWNCEGDIIGIVEYSLILCSGQIAPSIRLGETVRSWERIVPFIIIIYSNQGGENQGIVIQLGRNTN